MFTVLRSSLGKASAAGVRGGILRFRCFSTAHDVVVLNYEDIMQGKDLSKEIETAYGPDGLGILAVRGVPGYQEARKEMLPLAQKLATLPTDVLAKYEDPKSFYSVGWSLGKEKFNGEPDFSKGSFYANPLHDKPVDDQALIDKLPSFLAPNIWPQELPRLEPAFKTLGQMIVRVGVDLMKHCDNFVLSRNPSYLPNKMSKILKESRMCKGRLLYYYPTEDPSKHSQLTKTEDAPAWCGWHNDHGSLTGLATAMYLDADGNEVDCPDNTAGLYVRTRKGEVLRLTPPRDCIAYQIGETSQIHSGGALQATPHSVQAANVPGIGRATLAVFMEPEWDEPMDIPANVDPDGVLKDARGDSLPPGVPSMYGRWKPDQDFAQFSDATFAAYYEYSK